MVSMSISCASGGSGPLPTLFSREQQVSQTEVKQRDELIENLYGQIGRLSAELSWLQKKWSQG